MKTNHAVRANACATGFSIFHSCSRGPRFSTFDSAPCTRTCSMEGLAEALERSTGEKLSKYEELLKANSGSLPTKLVISVMCMLPTK